MFKQNDSEIDFVLDENYTPTVSVIIAAFNEEKHIENRIKNLLDQTYTGSIEIIVASDGSTDNTVNISQQYEKSGAVIFDYKENRGRASVHNDSIQSAKGEIIVTTDAQTVFEKDFIEKIVAPFQGKNVGCAVGRLYYQNKETGIAQSEGFYWKWEVKTRILQDQLGILMTGTGACTAFRKILFKPMRPIDDIDYATTIDVIKAGQKVRYIEKAIAYDEAPETLDAELNGRIRSSKRFVGTISRWGCSNWLRHPFYSWSMMSHKFMRWSSPFFLIALFISNVFLLGSFFYNVFMLLIVVSILLTAIGSMKNSIALRIPFALKSYSFFVANLGFLLGFIRIATGRIPVKYKMPEK